MKIVTNKKKYFTIVPYFYAIEFLLYLQLYKPFIPSFYTCTDFLYSNISVLDNQKAQSINLHVFVYQIPISYQDVFLLSSTKTTIHRGLEGQFVKEEVKVDC
jgi:hypothetical protein